jgi:hypothetical protein
MANHRQRRERRHGTGYLAPVSLTIKMIVVACAAEHIFGGRSG